MSDFATLTELETAVEPAINFAEITPPELPSGADETWTVTSFRDEIYLAWLTLDMAKKRDFRRIYRYSGAGSKWDTVYQQTVSFGRAVRREGGETSVGFSIGEEAGQPALFVRFLSPQGLEVLKSSTGEKFTEVAPTAKDEGSHSEVVTLGDHQFSIFQTETGPKLRTRTSGTADWADVDLPAGEVSSVLAFQGKVVVALDNSTRGFELLAQEADLTYKPIISRGAQRFTLNAKIFACADWKEALYLACGSDQPTQFKAQPGFEILRVYPDWSWDVVIGALHISSTGLKIPLAGIGPGGDEFDPASFRFLNATASGLLLGTYDVINGLRIWFSQDGTAWNVSNSHGMGGSGELLASQAMVANGKVVLALGSEDLSRGRVFSCWKSI